MAARSVTGLHGGSGALSGQRPSRPDVVAQVQGARTVLPYTTTGGVLLGCLGWATTSPGVLGAAVVVLAAAAVTGLVLLRLGPGQEVRLLLRGRQAFLRSRQRAALTALAAACLTLAAPVFLKVHDLNRETPVTFLVSAPSTPLGAADLSRELLRYEGLLAVLCLGALTTLVCLAFTEPPPRTSAPPPAPTWTQTARALWAK